MKSASGFGRLARLSPSICLLVLVLAACTHSGNAASTATIQTAVDTVAPQPATPAATRAALIASPTVDPGTPVPTTHTDAVCNPSPTSPYQGQPGGFTEVQGTATKGEFWALVFGSVPFQAGEGAKVVWALDTGGASDSGVEILAHDSAGNQIGPTSGPDSHLGSSFGRPGSELGSSLVFPHDGCWEVDATAGSNQASMWFAVDPAPAASAQATPEPNAPTLYPIPAECTASPFPSPSQDASGNTASWLTGDGIALGSIRATLFEGSDFFWWQLDQRAPLTLSGQLATDPGTTLTIETDLSSGLSTIYPTNVTFPAPGCWQLHASAGSQTFDTTVYVYPNACRPPSAFAGSAGTGMCEP